LLPLPLFLILFVFLHLLTLPHLIWQFKEEPDERARRSLFYYLAEAEDNAKSSLLNRGSIHYYSPESPLLFSACRIVAVLADIIYNLSIRPSRWITRC
jgi:hypothetical protein